MSMQFSRNLVIPVWFVVFAIAAILAPPLNYVFSLFLIVLGLAVPATIYMLWHDAPVPVALVAPSLDTERRQTNGNR